MPPAGPVDAVSFERRGALPCPRLGPRQEIVDEQAINRAVVHAVVVNRFRNRIHDFRFKAIQCLIQFLARLVHKKFSEQWYIFSPVPQWWYIDGEFIEPVV